MMLNPFANLRTNSIFGQGGYSPDGSPYGKKRFQGGVDPPRATPDPATIMPPVDPTSLTLSAPPPSNIDPSPAPKTPVSQNDNSDAQNYFDQLERMRTNKGPALTAYQQAVSNPPDEKNYEPSLLRTIGGIGLGALAGMGSRDPARAGAEIGGGFINSPWEKAQTAYKTKLGGLKESAQLEDIDTERSMKNLENAQNMGLKWKEYQLGEADKKTTQGIAQQNADTAQSRADAYIKSLGKPDYDYQTQADGSILAINKHDPKDRTTVPANTVAAEVARTGKRNADTNAQNARTNAANSDSLRAYRDGMLKVHQETATLKNKQGKYVTPAQKKIAYDLALRKFMTDPHYSQYIHEGDSSVLPFKVDTDDGSVAYKHFQADLTKEVIKIIGRDPGTGQDLPDKTDDSNIDIEIGAPK